MACKCTWLPGQKVNGFSEIEVLVNGIWVPITSMKIHKKKFVKSPVGIIPFNGYSGDKHSEESLEWLAVVQKEWCSQGKQIKIQHARTSEGEKVIIYQGKLKSIRYKVDGNLSTMVRNTFVNTMVVTGMVVLVALP